MPVAAAAMIAVAAVTSGALIPGGGPLPLGDSPATDCFAYARAAGTLVPNNQKYFVCQDGDAACDQDRTCNGTCLFSAQVCAALSGSSATGAMVSASCTPPPALDKFRVNKACPLDPPASLTGSACGAFVSFPVPLKGRRQQRVNRRRCTARAVATVEGRRRTDSDVYVFTCEPGPCAGSPSAAFVEPPAE